MVEPISLEEIKSALWSINLDKAPGPNGFNAFFFRKNWDLIIKDFYNGVLEFFNQGYPFEITQCYHPPSHS